MGYIQETKTGDGDWWCCLWWKLANKTLAMCSTTPHFFHIKQLVSQRYLHPITHPATLHARCSDIPSTSPNFQCKTIIIHHKKNNTYTSFFFLSIISFPLFRGQVKCGTRIFNDLITLLTQVNPFSKLVTLFQTITI